MLKKTLTKEDYAKLSADLKKEYVEDGEGFKLDVEGGFDDAAALKRAKDHEKKEASEAKRALKDAQEQLDAITKERDEMLSGSIPKGDVEKLKGSYETKLAKREKELTEKIGALTGNLNTMLVDNVANGIATKISTAPGLILPHIKSRLKADFVDGKAVTIVLGADGIPSALSVEDLQKEIIANKDFAPILVGSKGSGSGANGQSRSGAPGNNKTVTREAFDSMDHTERASFAKTGGQVTD